MMRAVMKPALFLQWVGTRLGWAGVLGLVLLAGAAGVWAYGEHQLAPERTRIERIAAERQRTVASLANTPPAVITSDQERLTRFYAALVPPKEVPVALAKLFEAAQAAKISVRQGEFQRSANAAGRYQVLQVSLPVKAGYGQVMGFVDDVLAALPALSLEEIVFKRETAGSAGVEATLKFALYLAE